jgi:hypothetical protein
MLPSNARVRRKFIIAKLTARSITRPPVLAIAPPLVPVVATILRCLEGVRFIQGWPELRCGLLPLHDLQSQTKRCMISDVAMHKPRSWIVSFEGNDHISISWKQNDIASWRIVQLQLQFVGKCGVFNLLKDGKVVTVQVYLATS